MHDSKIWRAMGAKGLLEYIASAHGEQHDAVVYDTGYEFDANSPAAVRFIASVAMTKASEKGENFLVEMPQDGSVVLRSEIPNRDTMKRSAFYRQNRENDGDWVYVPDSELYCNEVLNALQFCQIHIDDMTEREREEHETDMRKIKRQDTWYMVIHYYLPICLTVLFTIGYIIFKLTH